jgi:hypothetical protein
MGKSDYKNFMKSKFIEFYNSNPDYKEKNNALLKKSQQEYWSNPENKKNCIRKN